MGWDNGPVSSEEGGTWSSAPWGTGQVAGFHTLCDGVRLPDMEELYSLSFEEDWPYLPCQPRSHRERFLPHHTPPTPCIPHTSAGHGNPDW